MFLLLYEKYYYHFSMSIYRCCGSSSIESTMLK